MIDLQHPMILPFFVQIGLTFIVLLRLAYCRVSAFRAEGGMAEIRKNGFPTRAVNASDNLKNQFEIPVLFYALCLFCFMSGISWVVLTVLAWIYVGLRIFHAIIHCGPNIIFPWRFGSFVLSCNVLLIMFVMICLRVF
ncbi:MAPEG family protein [Litorimonas sp. WD9-15]|uniref:MAPEG family protein n=1 Tax=Litorimonas sp. WD9-15 TaxID=3418716 RepID=UPI003CFC45DA